MKENLLEQTNLTIVDVVAAGGMHDRWSHLKTSINSILFEPDPEEFKKLNLDQNNTSLVINSALSDQNKEVRFHVCKWQEVSSIYKPNLKDFKGKERIKNLFLFFANIFSSSNFLSGTDRTLGD